MTSATWDGEKSPANGRLYSASLKLLTTKPKTTGGVAGLHLMVVESHEAALAAVSSTAPPYRAFTLLTLEHGM